MVRAFLLPFLGHFALVVALYVELTRRRMQAVAGGNAKIGDFARRDGDPPNPARVARNLSNQFELPMFAYFAAAVLIAQGQVGGVDVAAAWAFLGGRLIHSAVQVLTDNVRLRGQVFVINFVAVCVLMAHVAWLVLDGSLR
jgi:hypothetical protein